MGFYGYIYMTTNLVNNKRYIGRHRSTHFDESYKGSGIILNKAIRKYGSDKFKVQVIEWCFSESDLNERERFWIKYYNATTNEDFYNITIGGQGGGAFGINNPLYGKRGKDNPNYGSKRTEEQKMRMHLAKLNNTSTKGLIWINNGIIQKMVCPSNLNYYLNQGFIKGKLEISKETCNKISEGVRRSLLNPDTIAKKRNNMLGNKIGCGRIWINNGIQNKFIKREDLPMYENWKLGMLKRGDDLWAH